MYKSTRNVIIWVFNCGSNYRNHRKIWKERNICDYRSYLKSRVTWRDSRSLWRIRNKNKNIRNIRIFCFKTFQNDAKTSWMAKSSFSPHNQALNGLGPPGTGTNTADFLWNPRSAPDRPNTLRVSPFQANKHTVYPLVIWCQTPSRNFQKFQIHLRILENINHLCWIQREKLSVVTITWLKVSYRVSIYGVCVIQYSEWILMLNRTWKMFNPTRSRHNVCIGKYPFIYFKIKPY